jgi:hypothetical protein
MVLYYVLYGGPTSDNKEVRGRTTSTSPVHPGGNRLVVVHDRCYLRDKTSKLMNGEKETLSFFRTASHQAVPFSIQWRARAHTHTGYYPKMNAVSSTRLLQRLLQWRDVNNGRYSRLHFGASAVQIACQVRLSAQLARISVLIFGKGWLVQLGQRCHGLLKLSSRPADNPMRLNTGCQRRSRGLAMHI